MAPGLRTSERIIDFHPNGRLPRRNEDDNSLMDEPASQEFKTVVKELLFSVI